MARLTSVVFVSAIACGAMALAACKPKPATLDPAADPIARQFFVEVREGADLDADPHLAHELKNATTEQELAQFRALIPPETPQSVTLQSWQAKTDSSGTTTQLTDLYQYADQALTVETALFKSPDGKEPVIVGFDLHQTSGGS
ncbi:MAG: hypothetical protein ACREEW_16175 [Caulobacteraceae bacterium]